MSVSSGLLFPHSYCVGEARDVDVQVDAEKSLLSLPDTSILFHRYLNAGKTINVYDWCESFKGVLDAQREHELEARARAKIEGADSKGKSKQSPRKGKGRGKQKAEESQAKGENGEEAEERWKILMHARFIRTLHELDYLGFLKHSGRGGGRKGEVVTRTVFGGPD